MTARHYEAPFACAYGRVPPDFQRPALPYAPFSASCIPQLMPRPWAGRKPVAARGECCRRLRRGCPSRETIHIIQFTKRQRCCSVSGSLIQRNPHMSIN
ncbi:uncharacterized protein BDV17DRAFT_127095 [Aspergillus undulatus]|uniref:uncharacterized protein n=1 Tax=Aspergillus undulatus TaxID=1810928 RepID=UPI003CCD78DE